MTGPRFTAADVLLLRAAVHPYGNPPGDTGTEVDTDDAEAWLARVRDLSAHPILREGIAVASPSLSDALRSALAGERPTRLKDLRRLAVSLARYRLRMGARPTPFGLFAGVAPARFVPAGQARLGPDHRTHTRPDAGWLLALASRLETEPAVLTGLRLVANEAGTVRGGRIELTDLSDAGVDNDDTQRRAVSLRHTPAVAAALRAAVAPITHRALVSAVRLGFPGVDEQTVAAMIRGLVVHGFLLTDLRPPFDCADPIGYLLERLPGHPVADRLRPIRREIAAYDGLPVGQGQPAFESLRTRMCEVQPTNHPLQVDLVLDVDAGIPAVVARELEEAAEALWRLSPRRPGRPWLRDYHSAFLERYGTGRAVALTELVSEDCGLGLPAPYRRPGDGWSREPRRASTGDDPRRDRLLARLVADAAARGAREVVLDDALMTRLDREGSDDHARGGPPASMEMYAHLMARSVTAMHDGDFLLVLGPYLGSSRAGAMLGRFAHLLGDIGADLAKLIRDVNDTDHGNATAVVAALAYQPRVGRLANVMTSTRWLDHRLPVGVGSFDPAVVDLPPSDLAVTATPDRLVLLSSRLGRAVLPAVFNVLNPTVLAPGVARFLDDLGHEGTCGLRSWDWGPLGSAPFLPRVSRGRTVLAPARWLVDEALLADGAAAAGPWLNRLARWRDAARVPDRVLLVDGDQCMPLDLDDPLHRLLFRRECERRDDLLVQEVVGDHDTDGWLRGPDGPHRCEIVVPLVSRKANGDDQGGARHPAPAVRTRDQLHLPGGEWLYAKVYTGARSVPELLRDHVDGLLDLVGPGVVDRWFFVRYADPLPHLRLRMHGEPEALWAAALPALREWAAGLRRSGLVGQVVLDGYDPEIERYGGPDVLAEAERAFHADSLSAVAMLRVLDSYASTSDRVLIGALSVLDLLAALGGPDDLPGWLARTGTRQQHREAFAARRREALLLADPGGDWYELARRPGGAELVAAWRSRRPAVADYGCALRRRGCDAIETVAASLAHMHVNRVFGIDSTLEGQIHAVARNTVIARAERERFGRR
ncbi:lantibiotic dehydratase [Asanoa ferruginea]|uniref:lantibiotic dehydratase n=1 Tax=Asanoa ferruginea TaxID=53367 RepID=UPI001477885A|nr:lantibiotic dehydratase [Asanoa ferruginea]GIF50410.1 lantibiotic dehydratase [Asanoa ferruginea]